MKRFFMILCLTVLLAVVLAVPTLAAEGGHSHCLCGGTLEGTEGHTCEDITYTVVTTADDFTAQLTAGGTGTVNICLGGDITISSNIGITGKTVNLCLNGHTITMSGSARITANRAKGGAVNGTLNITACKSGSITAAAECASGMLYTWNGHINMYSGTVNAVGYKSEGTGAIYVNTSGNADSFTLYGGTILGTHGDTALASPVIYNRALLTINGGQIVAGTASGGGVYNYGGTITAGVSNADGTDLENHFGGGNVCVGYESNLSVSGGSITDGACAMGREDIAVQPNSFTTSLSGAPVIGDLYLVGRSLTINNAMSGNQTVGVTLRSGAGEFASGDGAAASAGAFRSNEGYTVSIDGSRLLLAAEGQSYLVGYGQGDITPTDEDVAAGLYLQGFSNAIHVTSSTTPVETLLATAMAVTDAKGDTVLLISVDSCNIDSSANTKARLNISKATGVPVDNIAISSAHQHSTPYVNTVKWSQESYDAEIAAGNTPSFNVGDVRTAMRPPSMRALWQPPRTPWRPAPR